jgi:hypothetical protein
MPENNTENQSDTLIEQAEEDNVYGGELPELTVTGEAPTKKKSVKAIYGVNAPTPELVVAVSDRKDLESRRKNLKAYKRRLEKETAAKRKEALALNAKIKSQKQAKKQIAEEDTQRLGQLNLEISVAEMTFTDLKEQERSLKKQIKEAKKTEKAAKKQAKQEAKVKKQTEKEAEGEKSGNFFTRLFHRKKEEKDGGTLKAAQKKQKDTQKAADKANKEAAKAENKQQAAYQEYRASAQKYDTQYMVTYSTKDRADLVKDKLDKETAAFLTDKNEDGTPKYKTVAEKEKALKAEKAATEKEAKALLQKIKKDQANPVPGDENYFNRVRELDKQFSALNKQLTALDMDLATAQNIGKLSTEYTNLQKQFEKEHKKRVSIVGEKSDKWSAYIKANYRAEVVKAEAKEKNAEAEKARQDLKDQLRSQQKVANEGVSQTNATPEDQQMAEKNASKLEARLDEKPNETEGITIDQSKNSNATGAYAYIQPQNQGLNR